VIELRRKRLVVRQHQRRTVGLLDQLRHGERFSRTRHSEQNLMLFSALQAAIKLLDRRGLVTPWLVIAAQLEFHRRGLLPQFRPLPKPRLYSGMQDASEYRLSLAVISGAS
jgi:hypothetical protein